MISIRFPSVFPRMPGQFIDSFQFICFFMLLQGQILCPLCQDKLMATKRVKHPRMSKQDQIQQRYAFFDLFHLTPIFPPLHQLVCMEMVQNTLSWNILQTFAEKRPMYIVLPRHHKSHPLNLAHHISHHMTFYNINSSINFRFHCARQYPKLASHIFKNCRCAKVGGFYVVHPFFLCPQQLQGKTVPVRQGSIPRHIYPSISNQS